MTIVITADDTKPIPRPIIASVTCDEPECPSEDVYEFRAALVSARGEAKRLAKGAGWREYPAVGKSAPTHRCPVCAVPQGNLL